MFRLPSKMPIRGATAKKPLMSLTAVAMALRQHLDRLIENVHHIIFKPVHVAPDVEPAQQQLCLLTCTHRCLGLQGFCLHRWVQHSMQMVGWSHLVPDGLCGQHVTLTLWAALSWGQCTSCLGSCGTEQSMFGMCWTAAQAQLTRFYS